MEPYKTEEYRGCTIKICYDQYAENPRTFNDGYLSHIIGFHRNYEIGDKHDYGDERELMEHLARTYASYEQIEKYLREHRGDCWLEETDEGYTLHDFSHYYYDCEYDKGESIDTIIGQSWDYMSDQDLFNLAYESGELVISTISYYDHSGITVWIGEPNDPWDSGRCGYIYQTKKDTIEQNGGTEENWKEVAWENMRTEMHEYDQYVRGECYYWDVDDEDGNNFDGVGGYIGEESVGQMIAEAKASIDNHIKKIEEKRRVLEDFITANFENIPENQMFVDGCIIYRADRHNLFKQLQLSSAPIKSGTVGVFSVVNHLNEVPTDVLEAMRQKIAV